MPSNNPGWTPNLRLLTEALTTATMRLRQLSPSTYENDFAAASLLVKLLTRATSLRLPLDRACAAQALHAARSQTDLADLEQRGLIRFPLGWLHLPRAVRMELRRRADKPDEYRTGQSLNDGDEAALRALQDEMPDSADWNWISTAELDAIRQVHFAAHPLTPSAESLCEHGLLSSWPHGETAGYRIHLHGYRSGEHWQPVVGHAFALLWRELLRNDAFADDTARLRHWLAIAPEAYAVHEAPAFLETEDKERLLEACTTLLLAPEEAATPAQEVARLHFEFGLSVQNDRTPRVPPNDASNFLAQYAWWNGPEATPAGHLEVGEIDRLIMLVLGYDDAFGAPRAVRLVEGSVQHPYLLPATTSRHSPGLVTGLLANPKTVALGMKLLSEVQIGDNAGSSSGSYTNAREEQERTQTELWRKGVQALVDTCLPGLHAEDPEVIEQVCEVLGLTARAEASLANSAQATNERARAETRLTVLLTALERLPDGTLERLFAHLPGYFERRTAARRQKHGGSQQMPMPELRLAFWWLRVAGRAGFDEPSGAVQAAETIMNLYLTELKRETTPGGAAVYWLDDVPSAAQLPWHEVALVLQRAGRLADLLEPGDVSFQRFPDGGELGAGREGMERADEKHLLAQAWMHKVRLHTRALIRTYAGSRQTEVSLPPEDVETVREELLRPVERRLVAMVKAFSVGNTDMGRPSMFEADSSHPQFGNKTLPTLAKALVEVFNLFPGPDQQEAFSAWLQVEAEPSNLLVIVAEALSTESKQGALVKLTHVDVRALLDRQFWLPTVQQLAEQASAADQIDLLEKILAFGDQRLEHHALQREWVLFAYRLRLGVAARKGTREAVERVPAPPDPNRYQSNVNGKLRDPVKESRLFYMGLAVLRSDPEEARSFFAQLREERFGVTAYTVNWFAASLAGAQRIQDPDERRRAFEKALKQWQAARAGAPGRGGGKRDDLAERTDRL